MAGPRCPPSRPDDPPPTKVFVFVDFSGCESPRFYPVPANKIRPGKVTREDVAQYRDRWEDALRDAES